MNPQPPPPLFPGEHILWEGRPYTGIILRSSDWFQIPFSLFWAGFAVFWNATVWFTSAPLEPKLFGLPFLVIGFYVTIGRFLHDILFRKRLHYFVTDRRILIRHGKHRTQSLDLQNLPALELEERSDGSGTLRFGPAIGPSRFGNAGLWSPSADPTPQFLRITDVRSVYTLIHRQIDRQA